MKLPLRAIENVELPEFILFDQTVFPVRINGNTVLDVMEHTVDDGLGGGD